MPRQVKSATAAAKRENHWDAQLLGSLVGLPAGYLKVEGRSQFGAQELTTVAVTAGALHKLDAFTGVVRFTSEIELQIKLISRGLSCTKERRAIAAINVEKNEHQVFDAEVLGSGVAS